MGRPYRPHPDSELKHTDRERWKALHPKQETARERRARKRAEAEARQEASRRLAAAGREAWEVT